MYTKLFTDKPVLLLCPPCFLSTYHRNIFFCLLCRRALCFPNACFFSCLIQKKLCSFLQLFLSRLPLFFLLRDIKPQNKQLVKLNTFINDIYQTKNFNFSLFSSNLQIEHVILHVYIP